MNHLRQNLYLLIVSCGIFFASIIFSVTSWFDRTFGVTLWEILYSIAAPMEGADTDFLNDAVKSCLPKILAGIAMIILIVWTEKIVVPRVKLRLKGALGRAKKINVDVSLTHLFRAVVLISSSVALLLSFVSLNRSVEVIAFIDDRIHQTHIYEEHYIAPEEAVISPRTVQKNLIYIYLESLETTYASTSIGGFQENYNYIPGLTETAFQNISFSDKGDGQLGGMKDTIGTGWTMAALFSTASGVPFRFPIQRNSHNERIVFAERITTIGDILDEVGYHQEFMCGSEAIFAGRDKFFKQHGDFELFDYYSFMERGYIDNDYKVWWGVEDHKLFEAAKDELLRLAEGDAPFNFTLLTVDTHHVGGYTCEWCEDTYEEPLANVIACQDRQATEFVRWCQEQDFYEDTVIVVMGDHPRMDTILVDGAPERVVNNCFLNVDTEGEVREHNRVFTHMDMFPTVLYAMGFDIEGDRLGLGTNLFSDRPTLAEELGLDYLKQELSRYSYYYIHRFS